MHVRLLADERKADDAPAAVGEWEPLPDYCGTGEPAWTLLAGFHLETQIPPSRRAQHGFGQEQHRMDRLISSPVLNPVVAKSVPWMCRTVNMLNRMDGRTRDKM